MATIWDSRHQGDEVEEHCGEQIERADGGRKREEL
jgi:hypothetical protein